MEHYFVFDLVTLVLHSFCMFPYVLQNTVLNVNGSFIFLCRFWFSSFSG